MQVKSILFLVSLALVLMAGCAEKKPEKVVMNVQYLSGADEVTYLKLGSEIIDSVGTSLKMNLTKSMENGGPVHAVQFCNLQAVELTSAYNQKYHTEVRRVSDRNRNGGNAANEFELKVLADFNAMKSNGEPVLPKIAIDPEGRKNFYAPIFTGGLCLNCHGDPKNMQPELLSVIDSLYPNDKAKDYLVDELRGLWTIKFKNS